MSNLVMNFEGIRVGTIIHNDNGDDYAVVAINPIKDRTLLVKCGENSKYVGAWALQKCRDGVNWYWGQGHYFEEDFEAAVEYVMDKDNDEPKKIWMIHTNWAISSEESGSDAYAYATYEIAKREFDKLVREDKEVNYEDWDSEDSDYEHEETENYWCIWENEDYCENHSEIKLEEHIVEEK